MNIIKDHGLATFKTYEGLLRTKWAEKSAAEIVDLAFKKLNITISAKTVREHRQKLREGIALYKLPPEAGESFELKDKGEEKEIIAYRKKMTTINEVAKEAGIDTDKYDVVGEAKYWEMGSKTPDGKTVVTPLWSVHARAVPKKGWSPDEFRKILVRDINSIKEGRPFCPPKMASKDRLLAELSIFDAHFGKLAWGPESGENYDVKIAQSRYLAAAEILIGRALDRGVDRFLYVVGNDFFHVDQGKKSSTTSGTIVDSDGRWQKAFQAGVKCAIYAIEQMRGHAEVDVISVPGNHDEERCFVLGELLKAKFEGVSNVNVLTTPSKYVYYRYGTNLLGFTHGEQATSDAKRMALPQTMMEDRPHDYAETTCHEWHLGHLHHERENVWVYRAADSIRRCTVRTLPSISGTDSWHRANNYASVKQAEMHYYSFDRGRHGYDVFNA